jgi:hypothetical protein
MPDDLLLGRRCVIADGINRGRRGRVVRILEGIGQGANPAGLVFVLELDDPPGALVTADFRAIRLLPEPSPAHRSRQMAKMTKAAAQKLLKEHGIDTTGMNWQKIFRPATRRTWTVSNSTSRPSSSAPPAASNAASARTDPLVEGGVSWIN